MASITLYAPNFENLRIDDLQSIYTLDNDSSFIPISPEEEAKIPFIVRTPQKLFEAQVKPNLRKLKFTFNKAGISTITLGVMTQENLFTSLEVSNHTNTSRALRVLREIFKRPSGCFDLYIRDEPAPIKDSLKGVLKKFAEECQKGRIYRYIFKQKLQTTDEAHQIDLSDAILPRDQRPSLKPLKCFSYATLFEMTAILGLGVIEGHEDRRREIESVETQSAEIRVLERFRGSGLSLFSLFKTKHNYRFQFLDLLKIDWRHQGRIDYEV
jgi:hypothetical protein